jgi:uncharacterized protein DUF2589
MPVDVTAAQSAQSLLNGIDYSALIGGPLQAAIKAQAMAARSTWEFINEVGLQKDKDGQKSAVNVEFLYQKDGDMVKLILPVLSVIPIPLILIDEVSIQFKANINASASSTTEEAESTAVAGELEGSGKVGWGPFSISAKLKASYSSKKDSKATQDSRYSVEYTQDVSVHASQAGVPAGLATVLNILANAATGASRDGDLKVNPPLLRMDAADPTARHNVVVSVTNGRGLNVKGAEVALTMTADAVGGTPWTAFIVGTTPLGKQIPWTASGNSATIKVKTGDDGTVGLLVWLDATNIGKLPPDGLVEIVISATVDDKPKVVPLPIRVAAPLPPRASLTTDSAALSITNGQILTSTLRARMGGNAPIGPVDLKVTYETGKNVKLKDGQKDIADCGPVAVDPAGNVTLTFDATQAAAGTNVIFTFSGTVAGVAVSTVVPVTVT